MLIFRETPYLYRLFCTLFSIGHPHHPCKIPCLSEFQAGQPLANVKTDEVRKRLDWPKKMGKK